MMIKNSALFLCCAFALSAATAEESVAVSSAQLNISKAKTDVLGRHNSKVRNTPKAFVKDIKPKSLMKSDNYIPSEIPMRKTKGVFEYRKINGTYQRKYTLDDIGYGESEYLRRIQEIEDSDNPRNFFIDFNPTNYKNYINEDLYEVKKTLDECTGKESCVKYLTTYAVKVGTYGGVEEKKEYIDFWNYSTVLKKSNLDQSVIGSNVRGQNIGISFTENGLPLPVSNINYIPLASCDNATTYHITHGSRVALVLNAVAPDATLYGLDTGCNYESVVLPIDGYRKSPKIYIGNHSYGDGGRVYDEKKSGFMDDFIYNTRTIEFVSAGNSGQDATGQITALGRATNTITVGAVHNDLTYHKTSSRENPAYTTNGSTIVKPEIANFSDLLFPSLGATAIVRGAKGDVLPPVFMQTSSSTPYTAGSVALLLSKFPFYKWHPEVVKALLITSSVKKISGAANHDSDNDNKYAMGVPDGKVMFKDNRSRFWNGNNDEFFENEEIVFYENGIKANRRYRVAISWLSSGKRIMELGTIPQDIDIYVEQNNEYRGGSASAHNPFELVDFKTKNTGDLKITIRRFRNDGGRVLLGYNLVELPDEYQDQ